jgi:hypothetical protein
VVGAGGQPLAGSSCGLAVTVPWGLVEQYYRKKRYDIGEFQLISATQDPNCKIGVNQHKSIRLYMTHVTAEECLKILAIGGYSMSEAISN